MSHPLSLANALNRGRDNNLDLLRLLAASAVVISHAWPLALGRGAAEPLSETLGMSLGGVAVLVFFFLSGIMVTGSADRNIVAPLKFISARVLRIFPGLAVALLVTVVLARVSGAEVGLAEAVIYLLRGLSLVSLEHELTGAFATNPYPGIVNGPLWTLFYEVGCYVLVACAVWLGLFRTLFGTFLALTFSTGLWLYVDMTSGHSHSALGYRISVVAPVLLAFCIGAVFWRLRSYLVLRLRVALLLSLMCAAFTGNDVFLPMFIVVLGYWLCLLAFNLPVVHLKGDISYGIYIYGWPVAQTVVFLEGPMSPMVLAALSLFAVLPFAVASWIMVEKPALALVGQPLHRAGLIAPAKL